MSDMLHQLIVVLRQIQLVSLLKDVDFIAGHDKVKHIGHLIVAFSSSLSVRQPGRFAPTSQTAEVTGLSQG